MSSSKQLEEDFSFFIHQSRDYKAENLAANLERTCSICLNLLTQLPSSRQAIFDYFNSLLDIEIHCFVEKDSVIASKIEKLSFLKFYENNSSSHFCLIELKIWQFYWRISSQN